MHSSINSMLRKSLLTSRAMILLMCLLIGTAAGYAGQLPPTGAQKEISGTVIDDQGEPIVGATVKIKNSQTGTMTNIDGRYTLKAAEGDVIVANFIGYKASESTVGSANNYDFTLTSDSEVLDEVVVVGYGTVKKKDLTGAVSNIKGEKVAERHTTQLATALQGAIAGVQINRTNGQPGASSSSILIRGVTTIGDTAPLVIVDGVPVDKVDDINANDVESISVLKDAASAAIYGSRAAAGVILITTKRAGESDIKLTYNFEYGLEIPASQPKNVGMQRYLEMVNELHYNDNPSGGHYQYFTQDQVENWLARNPEDPDNYPITDWYDLMVKGSAPRQSHNVSLTGGSKKVKTRAAFSYDKTDGLFKEATNTYQRYMLRINNDFKFNKYISANVDLNVKYSETEKPKFTTIWSGIYNASPAYAPVWQNGSMADVKDGSNPYGKLVKGGNIKSSTLKVGGKLALYITPLEGLKLSAIAAPQLTYSKTKTHGKAVPYYRQDNPTDIAGYLSDYTTNTLEEERPDAKQLTTQLLANYMRTFGKHDLNVMAGYETYYYRHEGLTASTDNMNLDRYPYMSNANKDYLKVGGTAYENSLQSFFGRIIYSYDNRYLLQVNVRRDASSRFHKDHRWGTFPSASVGWIMTQEKFMKDINPRSLSFLKIRGSWGRLGNERIGNYPYISLMDFTSSLLYPAYGSTSPQFLQGEAQIQYAIQDITWETTESFNIGFDARFLDNRLSFTGDFYKKNTKDMLLDLEIPKFVGYSNPSQNAGHMKTTGYDLELSWNDHIGEVTYSVGVNFSDYQSKMGNLKGTEFIGDQISREGSYYNEWYGYVSDGLFLTQEDLDNSPKLNNTTLLGDVKFKDISGPDGVPDGKISPEYDRVLLGNSLPRFLYGGTASVQWKGIDFSLAFQGVGKQNVRMTESMIQPFRGKWGSIPAILDGNYWSEENTDAQNAAAKYPRLTTTNKDSNNAMSTFWMFNGRYFRMKNMTLGYTLPSNWTRKAFIDRVRVYVSGNDLFTFNDYPTGFDPERTTSSYPITKSVIFGLNVNF